jgi:hypothetical protein
MNPTPEFPATASADPASAPPFVGAQGRSFGSLSTFFYEQAQQALNKVDPVPLEPISPACVSGEAQDNKRAPAGPPYLADWSMDTRPSYKLSDAELVDKGRWQLAALARRERELREFEVPTIYPPKEQS